MKWLSLAVVFLCFGTGNLWAETPSTLTSAYKKEFSFLAAQKRALKKRKLELEKQLGTQGAKLKADLAKLEAKWMSIKGQVELFETQFRDLERNIESHQEDQDQITGVATEARDLLSRLGSKIEKTASDGSEFDLLFAASLEYLKRGGQVYKGSSDFFLKDGKKVKGEVLRVGNVAAFGTTGERFGYLVPVQGAGLKIWDYVGSKQQSELQANRLPNPLRTFLYEPQHTSEKKQKDESFLAEVQAGGPVAWVIVVLGSLMLAVSALRGLVIKFGGRGLSEFHNQAVALAQAGKSEELTDLCRKQNHILGRLYSLVIGHLNHPNQEDALSEAVHQESLLFDRYHTVIMVIAAVAPLLGLLGTVSGMISTFDMITEFGTGDPKILSGGISEALITTKLGLVVAVPSILLGNMLVSWARSVKSQIEANVVQFTEATEEASLQGQG